MSGRVHIANQYVSRRKAAFHTSLISQERSADPLVISDPPGLHNAADVQDYDHLVKILHDRLCQPALRIREAEVPVLKQLLRQ